MNLSNLLSATRVKKVHFIEPSGRPDPGLTGFKNGLKSGPVMTEISDGLANTSPDVAIGSIHYRGQTVEPEGLFVAVPGSSADGFDFIDQALENGAVAIISERSAFEWRQKTVNEKRPVSEFFYIEVPNARSALSSISAAFYGDPTGKMVMIGITGTNGKTTTARLIETILQQAGGDSHPVRPGVIGTHNYRYRGQTFDNALTTPEAPELQKILSDMYLAGITHVVMEVSSHGIDRHRVDNCWFDIGVFTNLSQDHLDYHGDMGTYWSCKKKWFTENLRNGPKKDWAKAVINCDHPKGRELADLLSGNQYPLPVITVGRDKNCAVWLDNLTFDITGTTGRITTPEGKFQFSTPLVGEYNMENIICAAGVGEALGLPLETIRKGIEALSSVPGRLESVPNNYQRHIYIDYAHSPDALARVLSTLRSLSSGRIVCVFGCGGDRDRKKRPLMGDIAARYSDLTMITSDNPRTEDPERIIAEICSGMNTGGLVFYQADELKSGFNRKGYAVEPDRKKAIALGLTASRWGDTVLISGKGNETYQIIGDSVIHFDDRQEVLMFLSAGLPD